MCPIAWGICFSLKQANPNRRNGWSSGTVLEQFSGHLLRGFGHPLTIHAPELAPFQLL